SLLDDGITYRALVRDGSLNGKRIALSLTLGIAEPLPAVRTVVERAAQVFAGLGAIVEPADPFSESPLKIFETLALGAFWGLLRAQTPQTVALMDPGLVALCRRGKTVTQEQYVAAIAQRASLGQRLRQFFDRFDLLLSPTMPIPAAYADPREDGLPDPNNFTSWMPYTSPFNLAKNPSCSIPCGFVDELPIGLMVTGPLWGDLAVLQACHAYEEAAGPPWPSPELLGCLDKIARAADAATIGKRWKRLS
ncbi:MAG TPA: amidase family protein, partial [Stellaceae bacterium]|nr:amidase family protein [Stellaceae bacterium]